MRNRAQKWASNKKLKVNMSNEFSENTRVKIPALVHLIKTKKLSIPLRETNNTLYLQIKEILNTARRKAYSAVNFAMVEAYWLVGKQIVEAQAGNERAEYGTSLLKYLSKELTRDFGKGFDESNLRLIRQFYLTFPIRDALRHELSWTHYRKIMKTESVQAPIAFWSL